MSRLTQILRGKKITPLTDMESAVKYAVDHAGGSSGGGDLPAVTSDDNGDVLTVVSGAWAKADPPTGLPAVSGTDNGKLLGVAEGAWTKVDAPTELPAVTGTDNGSVLGVYNGAWAVVSSPTTPYEISGTLGENESHKATITFNKTASVLFNAVKTGVLCDIIVTAGVGATMELLTIISCGKATSGDVVVYDFCLTGADGKTYLVESLSADDAVVLTEV